MKARGSSSDSLRHGNGSRWSRVGILRPGSRVVLSIPIGPIRVRWIAEHTEYERGRLFADRQVEGPFSSWYHRHLFLDDGQGGTLLRDEVEFEPPLGIVGRLLAGRLLESKLRTLFDYRHETTRRIVEAGDFSHPTPDRSGRGVDG